jgi:hypothetical protein
MMPIAIAIAVGGLFIIGKKADDEAGGQTGEKAERQTVSST